VIDYYWTRQHVRDEWIIRPPADEDTNPSTSKHISPGRSPRPRRHGQTPSPRSRGWRGRRGSS